MRLIHFSILTFVLCFLSTLLQAQVRVDTIITTHIDTIVQVKIDTMYQSTKIMNGDTIVSTLPTSSSDTNSTNKKQTSFKEALDNTLNYDQGILQDFINNTVDADMSKWYNRIMITGYGQLRYNDLWKTNRYMESPQGDQTYGGYKGFSLRRLRFKIQGQIHPRAYVKVEVDVASDGKNLGQLRDGWFEIWLDKPGTFKLRAGQSKVPFGFECMQTSQNRIALDRNEVMNSSFKDERDLGVGVQWAPLRNRKIYSDLKNRVLKGSGDYGTLYFMVTNGQKTNELIPNVKKVPTFLFRTDWPFKLNNGQYIEAAIQAYTGKYVPKVFGEDTKVWDAFNPDGSHMSIPEYTGLDKAFVDRRLGWSFIYYPQPLGIQVEGAIGQGPEYKRIEGVDYITEQNLWGISAQVEYKLHFGNQYLFPFTRFQYYDGAKKFEMDARSYTVRECEVGLEWQPFKAFEVQTTYTNADRRMEDSEKPINRQKGQLIRCQLQINF